MLAAGEAPTAVEDRLRASALQTVCGGVQRTRKGFPTTGWGAGYRERATVPAAQLQTAQPGRIRPTALQRHSAPGAGPTPNPRRPLDSRLRVRGVGELETRVLEPRSRRRARPPWMKLRPCHAPDCRVTGARPARLAAPCQKAAWLRTYVDVGPLLLEPDTKRKIIPQAAGVPARSPAPARAFLAGDL